MNQHLRFSNGSSRLRGGPLAALACLSLTAPLITSCQSSGGDRLLSVSESVPPKLAKNKPFIHVQVYFFTAPDNFQLLENTKGAHVAGIYSPQDGEKLVESLQGKRGFALTSAPSLTMRQGQRGELETIREFMYPTEYEPAKIAKPSNSFPDHPGMEFFPVTPASPTKFETKNLGLTASFEGRRNSRGAIDFQIELESTTFLGFVNYGIPITTQASTAFGKPVEVVVAENRVDMPVFDSKRLSSTITLADGHYLAIGGLRATPQPHLREKIRAPAGTKIEEDKNFFALIKVEAVGSNGQ